MKNIKVFCNAKDITFTQTFCKQLGLSLGLCQTKYFPNGEFLFQLNETVKQTHVIIVKTFASLIHKDIWELLQMVKTISQMQAKSITLALPYLPYSRQKHCSCGCLTSLFIDLLKYTGVNRIFTIDMHAPEQCSHWPISVINISIESFWINYLQTLNLNWTNFSIFGADKGASHRAEIIAKHFNCPSGYLDKKRESNHVIIQGIHGSCHNKHILLIDDLMDTGNTILQATHYLKQSGALDITVLVTHCQLDDKQIEVLTSTPIRKLILTDTLPTISLKSINISVEKLPVINLLTEAILINNFYF